MHIGKAGGCGNAIRWTSVTGWSSRDPIEQDNMPPTAPLTLRYLYPLLLATLCGLWASAASAATKPVPVTLGQKDKAQITAAACGSVGVTAAERLSAHTTRPGANRITVEVYCKPHAKVGAFPLFRYNSCRNAAGAWRCDAGTDAVQMTLPDARPLPVIADGVAPQLAVEIITEGTKLQVPPFHHPAILLMRGECRVSPHPTSPSPQMKRFDIACEGSSMLLTKDCWQGGCRYFISEGTGY